MNEPAGAAAPRGKTSHWWQIREAGTLKGLRFLWGTYRLFGRGMVSLMLRPTVVYFLLFRSVCRRASEDYLQTHYRRFPEQWDRQPTARHSARHFREFAETVVDKLLSWRIDIDADEFHFPNPDAVQALRSDPRGQLIIGSHMGNLEYCRGFMHRNDQDDKVINVLLYERHAANYIAIMHQMNPDSRLNLYQVDEFDISTMLTIKAKIDAGEWIFIAGDRRPLTGMDRSVTVDFMGRRAALPMGPYLLAKALGCPVRLLFSYRNYHGSDSRIHFEVVDFADRVVIDRKRRDQDLTDYASRFARELERQCEKAPYQWFNFFDFWLEPPE